MICCVLVVLLVCVNIFLRVVTKHNHELVVPDFTNMPVAEAQLLAKEAHLRL